MFGAPPPWIKPLPTGGGAGFRGTSSPRSSFRDGSLSGGSRGAQRPLGAAGGRGHKGWGLPRSARLLLVTYLALSAWLLASSALAQTADNQTVVVGEIKGIINPVMSGYVSRVIDEAERSNAPAVVFTIRINLNPNVGIDHMAADPNKQAPPPAKEGA